MPPQHQPPLVAERSTSFEHYIALWKRRTTLGEAEWRDFYEQTHRFLALCQIRDFEADLGGDRKSLIDDFFYDKIFATAGSSAGEPFAPGALCSFFKNYLKDRQFSSWERRRVSADDDDHPESGYARCACETDPDDLDLLSEVGLSLNEIMESASAFLQTLPEAERMYLALHACADDPEALSNLAKRFRVPSYHYKAKKLGITREKGEFENGYEKTAIGHWLNQDLQLPLNGDYVKEILAALKILCLVALSEWKEPSP